jgi:hypothetical protein
MFKTLLINIIFLLFLNSLLAQNTLSTNPGANATAASTPYKTNQTMKKVLLQMTMPGMTTAQFDQIWNDLRKVGLAHPKGLIYHAAGPKGNNMIIVDVWDSVESFHKFRETLLPILAKYGIPRLEPELTPVYLDYNSLDQK